MRQLSRGLSLSSTRSSTLQRERDHAAREEDGVQQRDLCRSRRRNDGGNGAPTSTPHNSRAAAAPVSTRLAKEPSAAAPTDALKQDRHQPHTGMFLLRICAAALYTVDFTAAIPRVANFGRQLRGTAHPVEDVQTGRQGGSFSPDAMPTAPDGMPECEIYGGPFAGQANQLDSYVGPGACDRLIASGKSCEHHFCPECNRNAECDKSCGYCESTADEPVDCNKNDCWDDDTCHDDEAARAAADPFKNELSPFTQGCAQIAANGLCEDQAYIDLGVLNFCCESCALDSEKNTMEGKCDFMAVVNGCQDPEAVAAMHSGRIDQVCRNACSVAVMDNWEICTADPASDFAEFQEQLEPIVTGCRMWDNGGHYDADALAVALGVSLGGR
jgi:hypothetical protein